MIVGQCEIQPENLRRPAASKNAVLVLKRNIKVKKTEMNKVLPAKCPKEIHIIIYYYRISTNIGKF